MDNNNDATGDRSSSAVAVAAIDSSGDPFTTANKVDDDRDGIGVASTAATSATQAVVDAAVDVDAVVDDDNDIIISQLVSKAIEMSDSWSHCTNSRDRLYDALCKYPKSTLSIEADIVMGYEQTPPPPSQGYSPSPTSGSSRIPSSSSSSSSSSPEKKRPKLRDDNNTKKNTKQKVPIMSHPPHTTSDLTVETFLLCTVNYPSDDEKEDKQNVIATSTGTTVTDIESNKNANQKTQHRTHANPILLKNIKLDIKEIDAIVPTLTILENKLKSATNPLHHTIYLNADIFPGPGKRSIKQEEYIPADIFLQSCIEFVYKIKQKQQQSKSKQQQQQKEQDDVGDDDGSGGGFFKYSLSLGYKVDYRCCTLLNKTDDDNDKPYYTEDDITNMTKIAKVYGIPNKDLGTVI